MSADPIRHIEFSGEESARFTRLAVLSLEAGLNPTVDVLGREPLTSRVMRIHGRVVDARLDGYMRYIVVEDDGAVEVKFWVGGSNSTRSTAAQRVRYEMPQSDVVACIAIAESEGVLLPGFSQLETSTTEWDEDALAIDRAVSKRDDASLETVLRLVKADVIDSPTKREAALGLRSFADLASKRISVQRKIERAILNSLETTTDRETHIALVENLGYFGTDASRSQLSAVALDDADPHNRWAAVVALGRLASDVDIRTLLEAYAVGSAPLEENWPSAAALLSIARRVEDQDQSVVEPVLGRVLAGGDSTLARYACLVLSRFTSVSDEVVTALLALLGDQQAEASARGYAALAISGLLHSLDEPALAQIEELVDGLHREEVLGVEEPEDVWATEFLAELSSLLEMEAVSARLNRTLSDAYTDWRADYYDALASYAQAEMFVRQGALGDASRGFHAAVRRLEAIVESIDVKEGLHRATATFRLDITRARLGLHELLQAWVDSTGMPLAPLAGEAAEVAAVYQRYSRHETQLVGPKHLSERELEYVVSTRRLVEVLRLLIELDIASRAQGGFDAREVESRLAEAADAVSELGDRFQASLARGLGHLVKELALRIAELQEALAENVPDASKQGAVRALLAKIRSAFGRANWPMPARACPVGGLGRGEVELITEGLNGKGSRQDPLTFPSAGPVVVNVAIKIQEMAPGGATRAAVRLRIGQNVYEQAIHAVEGPTSASIPVPEDVPAQQWLQAELSLEFAARDCAQTAARSTVYLRRAS